MHARQMAAMAEATRLTRQGRLVEATALIQQTLASPAVTRRPPDAPSAGEETGGTPAPHPAPPPALRAGEGTQPGRDRCRLGYPPPHSPQPRRPGSPPLDPARGPGHEPPGGPV